MSPELAMRLGAFFAVFGVMAAWELLAPRRRFDVPRPWRWAANLGLQGSDWLVITAVNALVPILAARWALRFEEMRFGLLHHVPWSFPVKFAVTILVLDFAVYLQHWAFHVWPFLWRFHKVHHADIELDVTSGVRFHPGEILISLAYKIAVIGLLGAHFLAVVAFEIILNVTSLFNHSNVRMPPGLERWLRRVLVTPDMHRVHHSVRPAETNSNYGFNVPWWDRLLGTYEAEPRDGHLKMELGLSEHRDWGAQSMRWLLALPFKAR